MKVVEEIVERVKNGEDLESILKEFGWQTFEELVAYILEAHGFETKIHYRFKTDKIYEIDVFAKRDDKCLLIECKRWRGKTASPSKVLEAVKKHKKKCEAFGKSCEGIIVTLLDLADEIEGMKIVPISKLNSFLLTI